MEPVECFLMAPTDHASVYLRRYVSESKCPEGWIHEAQEPIGQCPMNIEEDGTYDIDKPEVDKSDPRWPASCACGYEFTDDDTWQVFTEAMYFGLDGAEHEIQHLPAGAIFDASWMGDWGRVNGDGERWSIVLPDGHVWHPGAEANNCTRKGENHDCWCVHGEAPLLTVDKNPEPGRSTCAAGAGSIASSGWHGFLTGGKLVA